MSFAFIDESGDLGEFSFRYFTIAAVVVENSFELRRINKKLRERKLKKKVRALPEIKANNSNDAVRNYVLSKVSEIDCEIFIITVDKKSLKKDLFKT